MTRRQMVLGMLGLGAVPALPRSLLAAAGKKRGGSPFEPDRRAALAAAAERILPGAGAAGIPDFIDYWMSRYPYTEYMQKLFKVAAIHLDRIARRDHGRVFSACKPEQQDAILKRFQQGEIKAKNFPGKLFFEHMVRFVLEGFLGDPRYGGNRGLVGWKFMGRKECWWQPRHLALTIDPGQGLPY